MMKAIEFPESEILLKFIKRILQINNPVPASRNIIFRFTVKAPLNNAML